MRKMTHRAPNSFPDDADFRATPCGVMLAMLLFLLLSVLFCPWQTVVATPLPEYRARVSEATITLSALTGIDEEEADETERMAYVARSLAEVRRLLPPADRVEWAGEVLVVDNSWLHTALDAYARLPSGASDTARAEALTRAAERLAALGDRLAEIEGTTVNAVRDKEAEKGRLAAILRRPEYNKPASQGNALQNIFEQIKKWLRSLFPDTEPLTPGTSRGLSTVAQIFVYALALGVIGLVLWKFGRRLFSRNIFQRVTPKREARVVLGARVEADQTTGDLLAEAEQLARAGEMRGAIRKAYVALLCEFGDRGIVHLAQHKTNRDYLYAVRDGDAPPAIYRAMQPLTDSFEKHWYGLEPATETDWTDFRLRCREAMR